MNESTLSLVPEAQAALANSAIPALQHLRVEQSLDVLRISGSVPTYYYKQLAQEAVRAVARGVPVENSVVVTW